MTENLNTLKDIAALIGGLVLLFTFIKGTIEYIRQGTLKRVELFLSLEKAFRENTDFQEIRNMIAQNDPKVAELTKKRRRDYAAFFEIIALLINSGLIKKEIACYMFSSNAYLCWNNKYFWEGFEKNDLNWGMLRIFVEEMTSVRDKLEPAERKYSL